MVRYLTMIAFLAVAVLATPVPGFAPETLVQNSTAIVIGKIEYISSTPKEGVFAGKPVPGKEFMAHLSVDRVVKGAPDLLRVLNLHWTQLLPTWGSLGYQSPPDGGYLMFFLKPDELPNTYTFTSPYYPSVFAARSAGDTANPEAIAGSDEQITRRVIAEMCRFIESPNEDAAERTRQFWKLAFVKDSIVHDTAAKMARDSSAELRDQALFTLLRFKDAAYLPMAREEILRGADSSASDVHPEGLVLAITQEFPAAESVDVLRVAATARDAALRRTIAYALRSTRSPSAIPILLPLVDDPDDEVAWNAMHSLGALTNHFDWRPTSKDANEWQRCLQLWHNYAASYPSPAVPQ